MTAEARVLHSGGGGRRVSFNPPEEEQDDRSSPGRSFGQSDQSKRESVYVRVRCEREQSNSRARARARATHPIRSARIAAVQKLSTFRTAQFPMRPRCRPLILCLRDRRNGIPDGDSASPFRSSGLLGAENASRRAAACCGD